MNASVPLILGIVSVLRTEPASETARGATGGAHVVVDASALVGAAGGLEHGSSPAAEGNVPPAQQDPSAIDIELDLSAVPEVDAPFLDRDIREEFARVLAAKGLTSSDEADRVVRIRVRLLDEERLHYRIDVELRAYEQWIEPPFGAITCATCPQLEIVGKIGEHLPLAFDVLAKVQPPAPPEPPAVPAASAAAEPVPDPTRSPDEPRKARVLGPVGIVGSVVGLGGLGVMTYGLVHLSKGQRHEIDAANDERYVIRDPSRSGWALYGVGLGITAMGIVAISIDASVLHERRRRRLAVSPDFAPSHAGLRLRGRF